MQHEDEAAADATPMLTCYLHEGWAPRIRPAGAHRAWMDATPEQFAYRCLPLAMANAHGWEIDSPCGFSARWDGGSGVEAVEILVDADTPAHRRPVSLFGQGIVTWHVEGLFRTSPGWNLWVTGPANAIRDGIAPLSALIETDWAPYSFTMNWRFTRPGQWIRWEEGEPFCFFFPVQRGLLPATAPVFRPLADAPDLEKAFDAWSISRNAFQAAVRQSPPAAPADKWQKLYYRGLMPDGATGVPDHETKLRLCPFGGGPGRGDDR